MDLQQLGRGRGIWQKTGRRGGGGAPAAAAGNPLHSPRRRVEERSIQTSRLPPSLHSLARSLPRWARYSMRWLWREREGASKKGFFFREREREVALDFLRTWIPFFSLSLSFLLSNTLLLLLLLSSSLFFWSSTYSSSRDFVPSRRMYVLRYEADVA